MDREAHAPGHRSMRFVRDELNFREDRILKLSLAWTMSLLAHGT
jgi:hypothetical protein